MILPKKEKVQAFLSFTIPLLSKNTFVNKLQFRLRLKLKISAASCVVGALTRNLMHHDHDHLKRVLSRYYQETG